MKKLITNIHAKNAFYLVSLLAVTLLQACTAKKEVLISADEYHRVFYGPLYSDASPEEGQPGVNVQYHYEFAGWLPEGIHMGANDYGIGKVYASTDKGAASIFNPADNIAVAQPDEFKYHIFFNTGVGFVLKRSASSSLGYIDAPFYGLYRYKLTNGDSIFGGLGPYAALGVIGSQFGGGDNQFKRFDAGLGLTAGYTMNNSFSFNFEYQRGLINILNDTHGGKARNVGFGLAVGYPLDKLIGKIKGK